MQFHAQSIRSSHQHHQPVIAILHKCFDVLAFSRGMVGHVHDPNDSLFYEIGTLSSWIRELCCDFTDRGPAVCTELGCSYE